MKKYLLILSPFLLLIGWCSESDNWEYVIQNEATEIWAVVKSQAKYEDTQWFPSNFLKAFDECEENAKTNNEKNSTILCMYIALNINAWMCQSARENSENSVELSEIWYSKFCWLMIDWLEKMSQKIAYYNYKL